ncbi:MAG TPA: CorA family divalent cation transporter, partial [Candidatus Paceibacterota bacterium]|nr:CorA family divalent cation transporter [Candidatus Paceibacterota bacterium]
FPVLHGFGKRAEQEIDFVIGKDFLITARYNASDPLHAFAQAFEVNTVLGHAPTHIHGGHLFVSMARALYEALIGECHTVTRKLQDIEDRIFSGEERRMVIELSQTGRIIHDFREALAPHKEMLSSLEPAGSRIFGQEFSFYVRDLRGLGERVDRTIENLHGSLSELRETNNSLLTTKQNEIMKTLTVMAFIVLPLGLIADLFSINARNIEFSGLTPGFWILLATLSIVGAGLLLYFKRKEWL